VTHWTWGTRDGVDQTWNVSSGVPSPPPPDGIVRRVNLRLGGTKSSVPSHSPLLLVPLHGSHSCMTQYRFVPDWNLPSPFPGSTRLQAPACAQDRSRACQMPNGPWANRRSSSCPVLTGTVCHISLTEGRYMYYRSRPELYSSPPRAFNSVHPPE
jgi:hypothetical protein